MAEAEGDSLPEKVTNKDFEVFEKDYTTIYFVYKLFINNILDLNVLKINE